MDSKEQGMPPRRGPLSRAPLERPAHRVPWSDWAELSDRLAARLPRGGRRESCRGHRPDVIVCDITMPFMTGPEFYEAARRLAPELAGRFQFVTAGAFTKETDQFVRAHRADVMSKPFRNDELRAAIARRLHARTDTR